MRYKLFQAIIIVVLLSFTTSRVVYFGFNTNYSKYMFSRTWFEKVFNEDVFRYRILSKWLLLKLDDQLVNTKPEEDIVKYAGPFTKNKNEHFYFSFYYLNTFFLIFFSIVWAIILSSNHLLSITDQERYTWLFFFPILINFTQFVVTPYDISGYFFQILIIYIFLSGVKKNYKTTLIIVCLLLALSTLNRESSFVTATWLLLVLISKGKRGKGTLFSITAILISFISVYLLLRFFLSNTPTRKLYIPMAGNFTHSLNITGIFIWGLLFVLLLCISHTVENRRMIIMFHLLNFPYIAMCLAVGVPWEIRLYIPLLLGSFIFAKCDLNNINTTPLSFTKNVTEIKKESLY